MKSVLSARSYHPAEFAPGPCRPYGPREGRNSTFHTVSNMDEPAPERANLCIHDNDLFSLHTARVQPLSIAVYRNDPYFLFSTPTSAAWSCSSSAGPCCLSCVHPEPKAKPKITLQLMREMCFSNNACITGSYREGRGFRVRTCRAEELFLCPAGD